VITLRRIRKGRRPVHSWWGLGSNRELRDVGYPGDEKEHSEDSMCPGWDTGTGREVFLTSLGETDT
jgi:hypothetical protein